MRALLTDALVVTVAEPPAAGPGFVDGYPQYTAQDEHTVEAHVRVTEPCTVYFVLATDGGETPTAQQVRDNDPSIDRYLGGNLYRLDVATNEVLCRQHSRTRTLPLSGLLSLCSPCVCSHDTRTHSCW